MNEEVISCLRVEQQMLVPNTSFLLFSRSYTKSMCQVERLFVWISYEMYCRELLFSTEKESLDSAHKKIREYVNRLYKLFFESDVSLGE